MTIHQPQGYTPESAATPPLLPGTMYDLVVNARREGKWLRCVHMPHCWLSPDEMLRELTLGLSTTPQSWEARDPQDYLRKLKQRLIVAGRDLENFEARLAIATETPE